MSKLNLAATETPVAFLYVTDRARALAFYEGVLGLKLRSADAFGDYIQMNGALLRMTVMPDYVARPHPELAWNVADIRAVVETLRDAGVHCTRYPGMEQDELGIWTSPDGASKVAFFNDPDGNVLSISQG
ncbi:MAG: VOC family protein [Hyphomonadaceae bacterium]